MTNVHLTIHISFSLSDAPLKVKMGDNSLNFSQARSYPRNNSRVSIQHIAQVTKLSQTSQSITNHPFPRLRPFLCTAPSCWFGKALFCASPTDKRCSSCLQAAFHTATSSVHPLAPAYAPNRIVPYTSLTITLWGMRAKFLNCAWSLHLQALL